MSMDKERRKALQEDYKQIKTYMGVIRITCQTNGKVFVAGFPNLKNKWLTQKMQLETGRHPNFALQKDWNEFGGDAFSYEVLEEIDTEDVADVRWEVKQLEKAWLGRLNPYGETGYNRPPIEE